MHKSSLLSAPSVNVVNIGGDYEIGDSVRMRVNMMTHNSNDVITPTAATPAVTLTSLPCSEVALPSASSFLVFTSLHLAEICTLASVF